MDDSTENIYESREVDSTTFVEAVLAGDEFESVSSGRATVPQAWSGDRTFDRRGLYDSLVYGIESGGLHAETPAGNVLLRPNSIAWFHGGLPTHFVIPDGIEETIVFFCRFHVGETAPLHLRKTMNVAHGLPECLQLMSDLLPERQPRNVLADAFARGTLARLLCIVLDQAQQSAMARAGLTSQQQNDCLGFVHRNLHRFFALNEVASACGLNPAYFSTQFRSTFGQSFQSYVKQQRIHRAQSLLLETSLRIGEVAEALGYKDAYYFSRQFKEVSGVSPRKWRMR